MTISQHNANQTITELSFRSGTDRLALMAVRESYSIDDLLDMAMQRQVVAQYPFVYEYPASTALNQLTFYEHDHLGNLRVAFTPVVDCNSPTGTEPDPLLNHPNSSFTLEQVVDYYPYGKILRQYVNSNGPEKYLTTQHERDQETGLDYRGARYYDSDVARFLSLDPLAADYASWSPYNYVMGNPISLIDPDGRSPEEGCPYPPCGEMINRLEALYNAITDPIAQARDNAMNAMGSGLNTVGNWLNGLVGDGGLTLTSRKRDVPTNNADRKGNADRELNIDYLLDFNDAISIDGPNSPPTLPERGPQTFTEGYNKLWEAGNIAFGSNGQQGGASSIPAVGVVRDYQINRTGDTISIASPDGRWNGDRYAPGDTIEVRDLYYKDGNYSGERSTKRPGR